MDTFVCVRGNERKEIFFLKKVSVKGRENTSMKSSDSDFDETKRSPPHFE